MFLYKSIWLQILSFNYFILRFPDKKFISSSVVLNCKQVRQKIQDDFLISKPIKTGRQVFDTEARNLKLKFMFFRLLSDPLLLGKVNIFENC